MHFKYCDGDALTLNKSNSITLLNCQHLPKFTLFLVLSNIIMKVQLLEKSRKAKPTHPLLGQQQQKTNFIHIFPSHLYGLITLLFITFAGQTGFS